MCILADENVCGPIVTALRAAGYEVEWCAERAPGVLDLEVLRRSLETDAMHLTFDRDFGELTIRDRLPAYVIVRCARGE